MTTPDPPTPTHEEMRRLVQQSGMVHWDDDCVAGIPRMLAYTLDAESTAAELLKAQQREAEVCANLRSALGEQLDTPLTAFNMVDVLRGEWDASVRELRKARERIALLESGLDAFIDVQSTSGVENERDLWFFFRKQKERIVELESDLGLAGRRNEEMERDVDFWRDSLEAAKRNGATLSERIAELERENAELKEYKWKYEELCK